VPKENIIKAARIYGGSRKAGIFYTMGIHPARLRHRQRAGHRHLATLTGNIAGSSPA